MNKFKKEEKSKKELETKNLSKTQLEFYEKKESFKNEFKNLLRRMENELFSEETDYMYDSNADLNDRRNGKNPMSKEYTDKVNEKRKWLGLKELNESGLVSDPGASKEYCLQELLKGC